MLLPDLKTPLLWVLGILLAAALGTAAIERTQVLKARADVADAKKALSDEKLSRANENNDRNRAALQYVEAQIAKLAEHSANQTRIADALQKQTDERKLADARNAALTDRVQRTADQLAAALDREQRRAGPAAGGDHEYRPDPFAGLLAEGGQLLAEAGRVVAEGVSIVGRRDGEVAALIDVVQNDRSLCARPIEGATSTATLLPTGKMSLGDWKR